MRFFVGWFCICRRLRIVFCRFRWFMLSVWWAILRIWPYRQNAKSAQPAGWALWAVLCFSWLFLNVVKFRIYAFIIVYIVITDVVNMGIGKMGRLFGNCMRMLSSMFMWKWKDNFIGHIHNVVGNGHFLSLEAVVLLYPITSPNRLSSPSFPFILAFKTLSSC
jgi:hypothetical protein